MYVPNQALSLCGVACLFFCNVGTRLRPTELFPARGTVVCLIHVVLVFAVMHMTSLFAIYADHLARWLLHPWARRQPHSISQRHTAQCPYGHPTRDSLWSDLTV